MASQTFSVLSGQLDWAAWKDNVRDHLSEIDRYAWDIIDGVAAYPQPTIQVPPVEETAAQIAANNNVSVTELTNEHAMTYYNNLSTNITPHQANYATMLDAWRRANNLGLQTIRASITNIPLGIIMGMNSSRLAFLQLEEVYGKLRPDYEKVRAMYYDWSQMRFADDEDPAVFVHCFREALAHIRCQPYFVHPSSEWLVLNTAIKDSQIGWEFLETLRMDNHGAEGWMNRVYEEFVEHAVDHQHQAPYEEYEEYDSEEDSRGSSEPNVFSDEPAADDSSLTSK
jgi:hypothetical protein